MPTPITEEQLQAAGIYLNHEKMENGEARYRLGSHADGSCYIRCEQQGDWAWENSHSHTAIREMTIVQSGELIVAEYINGRAVFQLLQAGEYAVSTPGVPHNQCLAAGTVIHTIKFGDCSTPDWIPSEALDALTKSVSLEQAKVLAGSRRRSAD